MEITIKTDREYVPTWNGNEKAPEDDRIKIIWRMPIYAERQKIKRWDYPKLGKNSNADDMQMQLVIDMEAAVNICVTKIINLKIKNKSTVKDVGTGYDLVRTPGLAELVEEIGAVIIREMDKIKEESKN